MNPTTPTRLDVERCRQQYPAFSRKIDGRVPAFLDGPAGSQLPRRVIDAVAGYLADSNANSGGFFVTRTRGTDLSLGVASGPISSGWKRRSSRCGRRCVRSWMVFPYDPLRRRSGASRDAPSRRDARPKLQSGPCGETTKPAPRAPYRPGGLSGRGEPWPHGLHEQDRMSLRETRGSSPSSRSGPDLFRSQ